MTASVHCLRVSWLLKTVLLSLKATHFFVGIRVALPIFPEFGANSTHFQNELKETLVRRLPFLHSARLTPLCVFGRWISHQSLDSDDDLCLTVALRLERKQIDEPLQCKSTHHTAPSSYTSTLGGLETHDRNSSAVCHLAVTSFILPFFKATRSPIHNIKSGFHCQLLSLRTAL